jgi:hypothetical protein
VSRRQLAVYWRPKHRHAPRSTDTSKKRHNPCLAGQRLWGISGRRGWPQRCVRPGFPSMSGQLVTAAAGSNCFAAAAAAAVAAATALAAALLAAALLAAAVLLAAATAVVVATAGRFATAAGSGFASRGGSGTGRGGAGRGSASRGGATAAHVAAVAAATALAAALLAATLLAALLAAATAVVATAAVVAAAGRFAAATAIEQVERKRFRGRTGQGDCHHGSQNTIHHGRSSNKPEHEGEDGNGNDIHLCRRNRRPRVARGKMRRA